MLAADTNVVVRLLVSDDVAQQKAVRTRLERAKADGDAVVVSTVVLAEVAWVLDSVYGYSRTDIARAIRAVVSTPPFLSPERSDVLKAVDRYSAGGADFSDYLILTLAKAAGASTLLTFDRRLLRHSSCRAP
jgi:predicted nucleic-acid-binding protein